MSTQPVSTRTLPPEVDEVIEFPTVHLEEVDEEFDPETAVTVPTIHLEEGDAEAVVASNVVTSMRDVEVQGGESTRDLNFKDKRAEFISVTFWKDHPHVPLGISFGKGPQEPRISDLAAGSLAQDTPLQPGDIILSVNNEQVNKKLTSAQVANRLKDSFGAVTVVVHNEGGASNLVESMVMKENPSERLGISLRSFTGGRIAVQKIDSGTKFVNSLLNVGDTVLSINGTAMAEVKLAAAADLIKNAPMRVTILARTQRETGVVVAELSDRYIASSTSVPVLNPNANNANNTRPASNNAPTASETNAEQRLVVTILLVVIAIGAVVAVVVLQDQDEDDDYYY